MTKGKGKVCLAPPLRKITVGIYELFLLFVCEGIRTEHKAFYTIHGPLARGQVMEPKPDLDSQQAFCLSILGSGVTGRSCHSCSSSHSGLFYPFGVVIFYVCLKPKGHSHCISFSMAFCVPLKRFLVF